MSGFLAIVSISVTDQTTALVSFLCFFPYQVIQRGAEMITSVLVFCSLSFRGISSSLNRFLYCAQYTMRLYCVHLPSSRALSDRSVTLFASPQRGKHGISVFLLREIILPPQSQCLSIWFFRADPLGSLGWLYIPM